MTKLMEGLRLKAWREAKEMTQTELGKMIGVDKHQISRWEHGKHRISRMGREVLRRIGCVIESNGKAR